jgi:hypothetical protein
MAAMTKLLSFLLFLLSLSATAGVDFIPEASGICRMGKAFVIASDEAKNSLWLKVGDGVSKEAKVNNFSWDDMEGLATVDENTFFGMTSHSLTRSGKRKSEREQFVSFKLTGDKITKENSWSIRDQVLNFLEKKLGNEIDLERTRTAIPDAGGLNIEGLVYANGKFFLGLRSPLTNKGEAILVVLGYPDKNLRFLDVIKVDLKGNGIRGLDSDSRGILVLSGPTDDRPGTFDLNRFLPSTRALEKLLYPGFPGLKRPEGLAEDADGSLMMVQDFEGGESDPSVTRLKK